MGGVARICFFCGKRMAKEKSNYLNVLSKRKSVASDARVFGLKDDVKTVEVPRCPRCKSRPRPPLATPRHRGGQRGARPSPRRGWRDSRYSGKARPQAHSGLASSFGRGSCRNRATAETRTPACRRRIARRRGREGRRSARQSPRRPWRPSIVSIVRPSTCPTEVRQAQTGSPSMSTVQAPQSLRRTRL